MSEKVGLEIDVQIAQAAKNVGELRKAFDDAKKKAIEIGKAFGENSDEFKKAEIELGKMVTQFKAFGEQKTDLRESKQILQGIIQAYGATSKEAIAAAKAAASFKDEVGDANDLIEAFHPDKKFQAFSGAIQAVAGGFSAVQGAMALFGAESEELEKTLVKVQSAMALSQGINSVLDAKDKFQNLATTIKTSVVGAFSTLRAAMISTGIGALVVAVGYLVSKFLDMKEAANKAGEGQNLLNKAIADSSGEYTKAVTNVSRLKDEIKLAKAGLLDKDKVVKSYNDSIGKVTGQVKNLEQAERELGQKAEAYVKMTLYKTAANQALEEAAKASFEAEKIRSAPAKDQRSFLDRVILPTISGDLQNKADKNNQNAAVKIKESNAKTLEGIASDFNKKAADVADKFKLNFFEPDAVKKEKKTKEAKENPAVIEAKRLNEQLLAENDKYRLTEEERTIKHYQKLRAILIAGKQSTHEADFALNRIQLQKRAEDLNTNLNAEADTRLQGVLKLAQVLIPAHKGLQANQEAIEKQGSATRIGLTKTEVEARLALMESIGKGFTAISQLVGEQTVVGKAFAVAAATIDTYAAIAATLKNAAKTPAGGIPGYAIAQAVATGIFGLLQVKKIIGVKVPGKGGGGSFAGGSLQTSSGFSSGAGQLNPALQSNTTILDKKSIDDLANQALRAYVVESEITSGQQRIQRIKRSAIFG